MLVEALCSINSGQADKGDILNMSDAAANRLIEKGLARVVKDSKTTKKLSSPKEEVKKTAEAREDAKEAEDEVTEDEVTEDTEEVTEEAEDEGASTKPKKKPKKKG